MDWDRDGSGVGSGLDVSSLTIDMLVLQYSDDSSSTFLFLTSYTVSVRTRVNIKEYKSFNVAAN